MGKKVLVAMSGGVDSSVAAWVLLQQGCECVGATMRLYENETIGRRGYPCCTLDDVEDARAVARRLGIPHYVFNFCEEFDRQVMRRFADAYLRGDTPNPCVDCNRYLKFGKLFQRARELGMDYVATGHYAAVARHPDTGRWALRAAKDASRDQSYFLASLGQEQLAHALFPLSGLTKAQVRAIAEAHGFVNARKHDSQDICFVPGGDYAAFLERYTGRAGRPGDILDRAGNVLGRHKGAERYTLGQHKGLGLSTDEPLYVCGKSMADNTLTVGPNEALMGRALLAEDVVWGAAAGLEGPVRVTAKVRSRQAACPAAAEALPDGTLRVVFDEPQRAITPGQALALYQDGYVLAGATILRALE